MARALSVMCIGVMALTLFSCVLFGDKVPIVDACEIWEAGSTSSGWLTERVRIEEVENYLRDAEVPCRDEILEAFRLDAQPGVEFWRFHNSGNQPPALADGYAVVVGNKVVSSFYRMW